MTGKIYEPLSKGVEEYCKACENKKTVLELTQDLGKNYVVSSKVFA